MTSFYQDDLSTLVPIWNSFENYKGLLEDETFWECFINNLWVAVIMIPASIALAVSFAIWSEKLKHGKSLVRLCFIYPTFIPLVAAANIWTFIYTPIYGLISYILPESRLLADSETALGAVIAMLVWKQAGYIMLFYIAGLKGISKEIYEAAYMDGASGFKLFRSITWPILKPTTMYVFIIALTNAYKMVDHLYIMTKGGPGNATNVLLYYIYQTGFDYWNTGKAAAMTVLLVFILLIISVVKFYQDERKVCYE